MLSATKIRKSRRLAHKPRVDYKKYFVESESESESNSSNSEREGSFNTIQAIEKPPKYVMNQINTVKKIRLESGNPATVVSVRRSARIANKQQDEIEDITGCMNVMKINPVGIAASSVLTNEVIERPEFMEPEFITQKQSSRDYPEFTIQEQVEDDSVASVAAPTYNDKDYMNNLLLSLLFGFTTTSDMYGDIIKIADIIEQYPELVGDTDSQDKFRQLGSLISVKFLADEEALLSNRSNDISNAISTLLGLD